MSFLLGECKELNYTELVEINGGGAMGFLGKISITGNNNQDGTKTINPKGRQEIQQTQNYPDRNRIENNSNNCYNYLL